MKTSSTLPTADDQHSTALNASVGGTAFDGRIGDDGMAFLIEATRLLDDSLELTPMLMMLARLSLPHLGSWCIVDLLEGDRMHRLAIIHPDPKMQGMGGDLSVKSQSGRGSTFVLSFPRGRG